MSSIEKFHCTIITPKDNLIPSTRFPLTHLCLLYDDLEHEHCSGTRNG